jgi:hypothetical protein
MRIPRRLPALGALLASVALLAPADADTPAWVATYPVGNGAQHRLATLPEGDVWAVVDHNKVLRSTDAGLTWLPVNPVPVQASGVPLPLTGPTLGGSSETLVAPASRSTAYGSNAAALSVSRDAGLTWQSLTPPKVTRSGFDGIDALEHARERLWLSRSGFELDGLCPVPIGTTPVFSSPDGVRFSRGDIRYPGGRVSELRVATPRRAAALVVDFVYSEPVGDADSCSLTGEATTSTAWVTEDAGRTWRKAVTCQPSCRAMSWAGPTTLVIGAVDGSVQVSRDAGRRFVPVVGVPLLTPLLSFLQAIDCRGTTCLASVNGSGIYRLDGFGDQWLREASTQEAYNPSIGDLAFVDDVRAVSGGPNALSARTSVPVAAAPATPGPGVRGPVSLPGGAVLGTDGVIRQTWTVTR